MTKHSQRRKAEIHGYNPPPITAILPDTATITAAGVVARVLATLSVTGGTGAIVYTIANPGGLAVTIVGPSNQVRTTVDPVGTVGVHLLAITATDAWGKTLTENITVTLT